MVIFQWGRKETLEPIFCTLFPNSLYCTKPIYVQNTFYVIWKYKCNDAYRHKDQSWLFPGSNVNILITLCYQDVIANANSFGTYPPMTLSQTATRRQPLVPLRFCLWCKIWCNMFSCFRPCVILANVPVLYGRFFSECCLVGYVS